MIFSNAAPKPLNDNRTQFWGGFAAGALIGTAAALAAALFSNAMSKRRDSRVVRFEESLQIGRPLEEVFKAWSDLEALPRLVEKIKSVAVTGDRSSWVVNVDGKDLRWQAETTQFIPNEAIGWKSISGPKHTGRINFSKLGNDTLVHVTMNYAPPLGIFSGLLSAGADHIEGQISEALRDFKAALEDKGQSGGQGFGPSRSAWRPSQSSLATGTLGPSANPVEYTRPPEASYPIGRTEFSPRKKEEDRKGEKSR